MAEPGQQAAMDTSDEDREALIEQRANRIMKIFGQVTECLDDQEVSRINEMLSQAIELCREAEGNPEGKPIPDLNKIYVEYLLIVEFRAGISVNLIKQSIRAFLMIEDDIDGLGKKVSDMFKQMIFSEYPTLAIDMELSNELLNLYFKLLSEGHEKANHIRLMVVGMFGVGKTTLIRRLCNKNIDEVESTEGIDIFLDSCEVMDNCDWEISDEDKKEKLFNLRLQELVRRYPTHHENASKEDTDPPTNFVDEEQNQVQALDNVQDETPRNAPNTALNMFKDRLEQKKKDESIDILQDFKRRAILEETQEKTQPLRRPTVSIWDFAGQSVYYSTHHFFLNARSIYILVLNLSKDLHSQVEEKGDAGLHSNLTIGNNKQGYTCLDAFKFWMKSIYIYTKQRQEKVNLSERPEYTPKILLVGTHKDLITKKQLKGKSIEIYKNNYFNEALSAFLGTPVMKLVHKTFFLVSNTNSTDVEMLSIKQEIFSIAKESPFLEELVPARFIPLEKAIFHSKREKRETMMFEELKNVNNETEFPQPDEKEIKLFLFFQHAFGNVIYFNMETLNEVVILTPQWIVNVFKAFVTHKREVDPVSELQAWIEFRQRGVLKHDLIDKLLKQANLDHLKGHILQYMEHLDVMVKPVIFTNVQDQTQSNKNDNQCNKKFHFIDVYLRNAIEEEDFYIMPCMLPPRPDVENLQEFFKREKKESPTLCLYIKEGFLPPFVVHCILATCLREMPIKVMKGKTMLFNGLGSFALTEKKYITIWTVDNIIHLKVSFKDNTHDDEIAQYCREIKAGFVQLVLSIFNFHSKNRYNSENLKQLISYSIKCPKCIEQVPYHVKTDGNEPLDYTLGLLGVRDLQFQGERECKLCNKMIHKEILKIWFEEASLESQGTSIRNENRSVSKEVQASQFTSNVVVADRQLEILDNDLLKRLPGEQALADIAQEITKLGTLASELQIEEKKVETERHNHGKPFSNFIFHILYQWRMKGQCWKILHEAMSEANISTENFMRIVSGKECIEVEEKCRKVMDKIQRDEESSLDDRDLVELVEAVGDEYWLLGIRLGIGEKRIQQISNDHPKNCKAVIKTILFEWKEMNKDLFSLIKAFYKSGSDMIKVVDVLKETNERAMVIYKRI